MNNRPNARRRLLTGAAALASLPALTLAAPQKAESARPHILWLVAEDHNPFLGAYGDDLAHTPHIDRLAARGILYRHVYSNAPVCAPSRFGIITGMYAEGCGPAHHMRATARLPGWLRGFPQYLREAGYHCSNNDKTDYNSDLDPRLVWDVSSPTAHWRSRQPGQPFFAVFNHMTTHESRLFGPQPVGRVRPEQVRVPAYLPDVPEVRADIAAYHNLIDKVDGEIGARLAELEADGLAEDTIVFFYSDNGGVLPRSKRHCYEEGLRCAMVVSVPEKWRHLAPSAPGSEIDTPVSFIDLAPTVLRLAGIQPPAHMQGQALLGAQTAPAAQLAFGMRNRMDERYDMVRTVSDGRWRYIRNYLPHRIGGQHVGFAWLLQSYQAWERAHRAGQLNAAQEAFWQARPFEELYDLQTDPDQVRNLARDPRQRGRRQRLSAALDAHMRAVHDNGFIPEGAAAEGWEASRVPGAYPLARIMTLAATAARRDPRQLATLQRAARDPNEVVRHWAAQGLLMLGRHALPARQTLHTLAQDPLLQNRIVALEALASLTRDAQPVQGLITLLDAAQPAAIRLQALNALSALAATDRALLAPALPVLERLLPAEPEVTLKSALSWLQLVLSGQYSPERPTFDLAMLRAAAAKAARP